VVEEVENKIHVGSNSWYFGGVTQHQKRLLSIRLRHIEQGRIMDLTLDNVIRFEEMQNWLSMSLTKC
jgi:hypothetical protein